MKILSVQGLALLALAPLFANAETRMQVAVGSTPVYSQPSASAQQVGQVSSGDILFVAHVDGDWAAISPPENFNLWLNKDFIEGNRVVAKSIQVRSGPGVQFDVVGTLTRGAPVMPRGEEGDWCKIAPPSSTTLWVQQKDLSEVRTRTSPIQEVSAVPEPPKPIPAPQPIAAAPPAVTEPAPEGIVPPAQPETQPSPAPQVVAQSVPVPPAPVKITPSNPTAPAPAPVPIPAPQPVSAPSVATLPAVVAPQPISPHVVQPQPAVQPKPVATPRSVAQPTPTLRPATSLPSSAPQPTATAAGARPAPPIRRSPAMPANVTQAVPAPASTVVAQKPKYVGVNVDQTLVDELDLADLPNQGKPVQVEGELRNAPFMAASPTRYRLQGEDEDGNLEMICHIHGDSAQLRGYIGKGISIRGREYWVEGSDMPVVVVGQIVPLAPVADEDEPVMF